MSAHNINFHDGITGQAGVTISLCIRVTLTGINQ